MEYDSYILKKLFLSHNYYFHINVVSVLLIQLIQLIAYTNPCAFEDYDVMVIII